MVHGTRGCPGKLYTNLDATQVIRTGEHAEGCRVDAHAFYHQQQLNELKRLAAGDLRPVLEIYDELASNAFTSLETAAHFPTWEQARNTMYYSRSKRYPRLPARRQDQRLTVEQTTTKSGAQFLMYHSLTNDVLIFATEDGHGLTSVGTISAYLRDVPACLRKAVQRYFYSTLSVYEQNRKVTMISYVPRKNSNVLLLTSCHAKLKPNRYIMLMLYFIVEVCINNAFLLMRHQQSYQRTQKSFMRELSAGQTTHRNEVSK
ncbi:hypothetical protein T08_13189 [Trichinella sp. T8]|nr:hypothetical protein T08_13189 [Trichinella sp. T8]